MSRFDPSPFNPYSVSNLMTMNYIRYERMYNLSEYAFYGERKEINTINVFIDMSSMVRCLYRLENTIPQPSEIAASIINLCAHIRDYYRSRHRVNTIIYIVHGLNCPNAAIELYPEYNAHYMNMVTAKKFVTDAINKSTELISLISLYLKGIYFVQDISPYAPETSCIIGHLISSIGNDYPNIIYTKDRYAYQLVATRKMTFVFRPKKYRSEDKSYVVTKSTLYERFRDDGGLKKLNFDISNLSPNLFSLMLAMSGFPDRHIANAFGNERASSCISNTTALLRLSDAVDRGVIINGYNSSVYDIHDALRIDPSLQDLFTKRYEAIDLIYQSVAYSNCPSSKLLKEKLIDLYDPNGIQEINNEFFREFPLDLNKL